MSEEQIAEIAAGLTKAQREVVCAFDIREDHALPPYCGWWRRQGGVMTHLATAGLATKVPIPRAKQWHYSLTPLGLRIRQRLLQDTRP